MFSSRSLSRPTPSSADSAVRQALARVEMEQLIPALDSAVRWKTGWALARLLTHRPAWVIHDESMMELEEETRKLAVSIFNEELRHAALLNFGRGVSNVDFFYRSYRIRTAPLDDAIPLQFPA